MCNSIMQHAYTWVMNNKVPENLLPPIHAMVEYLVILYQIYSLGYIFLFVSKY